MSGEPTATTSITSPAPHPSTSAPGREEQPQQQQQQQQQPAEKAGPLDDASLTNSTTTTSPATPENTSPPQSPLTSPSSPFASDETYTNNTAPSSAGSSPSVRAAMSDANKYVPIYDTDKTVAEVVARRQEISNGQNHADLANGKPANSPAPAYGPSASQEGLLSNYTFPDYKMRKVMNDSSKTPLVLVACGSFNPPTFAHLRMFEMAFDYVRRNTNYELVGEFISPVGNAYKKAGLAEASHRITMCELAVKQTARITVDPWEAFHRDYIRTATVISHFEHEINTVRKGIQTREGERRPCSVALLAGADLIGTMSTPGVWSDEDLDFILGRGAFIIERSGTSMQEALVKLQRWRNNIYIIPQLITNDISSTKIRAFLKKDLSVQYLIHSDVIAYIEEQNLYDEDGIRPRSRSASVE